MDQYLNDIWTFYFHDPFDSNWNMQSYQKISDISTIEDFWKIQHQIKDRVKCGMFFCMREYIFPCWDDPMNINGSCISIKVLKENVPQYWEQLMIHLLGETIIKQEQRATYWKKINGISISAKKSFCIIKIWLCDNEIKDTTFLNIPTDGIYGEILFKSNNESLQTNHSKLEQ